MQASARLFITENKQTEPCTSNVSRGSDALYTQTQVLSPRLPEPAWESWGVPRIDPAAVLAPLRSLGYKRGVIGGRRSPKQCPFWCLGFSALVPRRQILRGIAKSALATGRKGTKSWAPALSRPLRMPLNKKPKEQRGTPHFLHKTKSACRCIIISGRAAASAEASQPEREWNMIASGAGVNRLPQAPSSQFPLPASYSAGATTYPFSELKEGAQDHGSPKSPGFQMCQGRLRCQASGGESLLASQLHF